MDTAQQVELYRRQYFQLVDPQRLQLPLDALKHPDVQQEIFNTMFSTSDIVYLPPERYRFRVLKALIDVLQQAFQDPEEDEISDSLTSCFAHLAAQHTTSNPDIDSAQQKAYVTYTLPVPETNAPTVTTLEARSVLSSAGNTGVRTWEAALRLATYLLTNKSHVDGKNILELGAGTGFLSILCAKHLKPDFVLATDGSAEVVDLLWSTIHLNGLKGVEDIRANVLRWGHTLVDGVLGHEGPKDYNLILGADVTYDEDSIPPLVATLGELFDRYPAAKAIISATLRNEKTLGVFTSACNARRFHTERLQMPLVKEEHQLGFFFPTATPILIFLIAAPGTRMDPLAVSSSEESQ